MSVTDADVFAFAELLKSSGRVLLTTHVRPDGDALGTTGAMQRALAVAGVEARCLVLSDIPPKYAFLYDGVPHDVLLDGGDVGRYFTGIDTLLVCDTGTWSQLPGLQEHVEAFGGRKLVLDHHVTQQDWPDTHLVDTTAGAAAEVAKRVIAAMGVSLTKPMATCLYAAMATDTGWFSYSNASSATLRHAADCVDAGANPDELNARLYRSEAASKVRLFARGLASMQLHAEERLSVMTLRRDDYAEATATAADGEDLINEPMKIASVEASLLLGENPDNAAATATKVSLRSKGKVDCAALLATFGGGGHPRAAGAGRGSDRRGSRSGRGDGGPRARCLSHRRPRRRNSFAHV